MRTFARALAVSHCLLLIGLVSLATPRAASAQTGILLIAHGGSETWNQQVLRLAAETNRSQPTEVAFGMASRATLQDAVDRLAARGVKRIVAVPLFVSSWSPIITSTEYLLGLRAQAPPELAVFAKMSHGPHPRPADHHATTTRPADHHDVSPTSPVVSRVPITRITPALNAHAVVAAILADRALSISRDAGNESVVLVAHGPNGDEDNRRWLADIEKLAQSLARSKPYASIDYLTVRDDAAADVKAAATERFRRTVERRTAEGKRVLIVPVVLSFGGIEKGIAARLDGLTYTMADRGLLPDDRLVTWILEMAR